VYEEMKPGRKMSKFIEILGKHIKNNTTVVMKNNKQTPRHRWITKGLLNSVNEKIWRHKELQQNPVEEKLKQEYLAYRTNFKS
ncbi:hypothetical protein HHI36_008946, partial [Cryptolaemus montrouzieri]